jgi:hypothetical protein
VPKLCLEQGTLMARLLTVHLPSRLAKLHPRLGIATIRIKPQLRKVGPQLGLPKDCAQLGTMIARLLVQLPGNGLQARIAEVRVRSRAPMLALQQPTEVCLPPQLVRSAVQAQVALICFRVQIATLALQRPTEKRMRTRRPIARLPA